MEEFAWGVGDKVLVVVGVRDRAILSFL